jgi:hypothetical protein
LRLVVLKYQLRLSKGIAKESCKKLFVSGNARNLLFSRVNKMTPCYIITEERYLILNQLKPLLYTPGTGLGLSYSIFFLFGGKFIFNVISHRKSKNVNIKWIYATQNVTLNACWGTI